MEVPTSAKWIECSLLKTVIRVTQYDNNVRYGSCNWREERERERHEKSLVGIKLNQMLCTCKLHLQGFVNNCQRYIWSHFTHVVKQLYYTMGFFMLTKKKKKSHYPQINRPIIIGSISRRAGQFSGRSLFCPTKSNLITSPPETKHRQFALYWLETCLQKIESLSNFF